MLKSIMNILSVSCGYAAAIVGAGFASGQEIVSFFVRYGRYSIIGVCIACAIFTLFSYAVLGMCVKKRIYNYKELVDNVFSGEGMKKAVNGLTLVFAAVSLCVMTACAGEMALTLLKMPRMAGALFFTLICGLIFFLDGKKIMNINSVLGAVIIFGIILSCLYILRYREHQTFASAIPMAVSGVAYAGYNLITVGAMLSGMSVFLKNKRDAATASVVSGTVLFFMMSLIWAVLGIYYGKINLGEIPMLTMALRQNEILGVFYGVMLMAAVLTTAVSNGFGIIDMSSKRLGKSKIVVMIMILGFSVSGFGFSGLINIAYRVCGYGGMVIVFAIIGKAFAEMRKSKTE